VYNGLEHIREEKEKPALKYHRDHPNELFNYVIDKFGILKSSFKYRVKGRSIVKKISLISAMIDN
jgi:hypothetical protein